MARNTTAAIIDAETTTSTPPVDILEEVIAVATKAVAIAVTSQAHRAATCGCAGCKAQAIEAAEWAAEMLDLV